jgi:hypothetical protein
MLRIQLSESALRLCRHYPINPCLFLSYILTPGYGLIEKRGRVIDYSSLFKSNSRTKLYFMKHKIFLTTATLALVLLSKAQNTNYGTNALANNTNSSAYNSAFGYYSLFNNTDGYYNTANGAQALYYNTTGNFNTANGVNALFHNNSDYNTANGWQALFNNITGSNNTANGVNTLLFSSTGSNNTANGVNALYHNNGSNNTANGVNALFSNTSGSANSAMGYSALTHNIGGTYNSAFGWSADVTSSNLTNATAIGNGARVDASNKVRIGNTAVKSIGGQVGWTTFSDGRYKRDIKENVPGLAFINILHPITYTVNVKGLDEYYNKGAKQPEESIDEKAKALIDKASEDAGKIVHTGFVAQEVEAAAKKLNYDFGGVDKPQNTDGLYGLRYEEFIMPLVKAVQELSAKNEDLQKQIDELKGVKTTGIQSTASAQSATKLMLTSTSLGQNQPNPFTGATTIRYNLPAGFRAAQLVITDNNGKTIKQVQLNTAGNGTVNIDASTLSSGTYNYTLVVDGKVMENKKMIVAH